MPHSLATKGTVTWRLTYIAELPVMLKMKKTISISRRGSFHSLGNSSPFFGDSEEAEEGDGDAPVEDWAAVRRCISWVAEKLACGGGGD
mgnify:FL=1